MKRKPFVHPTAIVESNRIGEGTRVYAWVHIMDGVKIGKNCNVGDHCFLETGAVVGNDVTIKNGNLIWAGITIQDGVFLGPQVCFTNDRYPRSPRLEIMKLRYRHPRFWLLRTRVEKGASIGAGAVLLPNITVGEYSLVAAGAVVTGNVEAYSLVSGNPARPKGWVCRCGHPLVFKGGPVACARYCKLTYQLVKKGQNRQEIKVSLKPGKG